MTLPRAAQSLLKSAQPLLCPNLFPCLFHFLPAGLQQQVAARRDPVAAAARGDARPHALRWAGGLLCRGVACGVCRAAAMLPCCHAFGPPAYRPGALLNNRLSSCLLAYTST